MKILDIFNKRPLIISGPCSAETREQTLETCRSLAATGRVDILRAGIWKPRTTPGCFEGVGLPGLEWLAQAKAETGLPMAIEVATALHVESALAAGVDMLWIGARTTVNPFSVQEIADSLRGVDVPVMIKNPMHADIALWAGAVQRFQATGVNHLGLIHRGFSTYGETHYRNHPRWHLAIEMRMLMPELPMICDPSHIGGRRELLLDISQRAANLNYDGLMIESHRCPHEAWSDSAQQVTPADLVTLLDQIDWRSSTTDKPEYRQALDLLRNQIDHLDAEMFMILSKRMAVAQQIGEIKRDNHVAILQTRRWDEIVHRAATNCAQSGLSHEFITAILNAIHAESIARQNNNNFNNI